MPRFTIDDDDQNPVVVVVELFRKFCVHQIFAYQKFSLSKFENQTKFSAISRGKKKINKTEEKRHQIHFSCVVDTDVPYGAATNVQVRYFVLFFLVGYSQEEKNEIFALDSL